MPNEPRTLDELFASPGPWEVEVLAPCPRWLAKDPLCTCRYCCTRAFLELDEEQPAAGGAIAEQPKEK